MSNYDTAKEQVLVWREQAKWRIEDGHVTDEARPAEAQVYATLAVVDALQEMLAVTRTSEPLA